MRDLPSLQHGAPHWTVATGLALLLAACPPPADDDDTVQPEDPWVAEQTDLDAAALSIWGNDSSDVWVAGAEDLDNDADEVPLLLHRDGGTWEQLDTGEWGQAWWVVGDDDEVIWIVGSHGLIVRHDRAAGSFTRVATNTEATLFGAWVDPSGTLYAVGGVVDDPEDGPVLLLVDGDVASEVTGLPPEISTAENFFKVWGSAEDDIWVISDRGTVLHFDGSTWGRSLLPDAPRLVTIHGSAADDLVVVGGAARATMFSSDGLEWEDSSPASGSSLNGVFLRPGGAGFAAGFDNFMMERSDGVWTTVEGSLQINSHWHGVWLDEGGAPWVVGGNILRLSGGIVARRENL